MSNMQYDSVTYGADTLILKRPVYEGIPVTLDFTNVTDKDAVTGLKIVKAGCVMLTYIGSNCLRVAIWL